MDDLKTIDRQFDKLTLVLQHAVEDATSEAVRIGPVPKYGLTQDAYVALPAEEWGAVQLALKAIHDYAASIVRAQKTQVNANAQE